MAGVVREGRWLVPSRPSREMEIGDHLVFEYAGLQAGLG